MVLWWNEKYFMNFSIMDIWEKRKCETSETKTLKVQKAFEVSLHTFQWFETTFGCCVLEFSLNEKCQKKKITWNFLQLLSFDILKWIKNENRLKNPYILVKIYRFLELFFQVFNCKFFWTHKIKSWQFKTPPWLTCYLSLSNTSCHKSLGSRSLKTSREKKWKGFERCPRKVKLRREN